MKDCFPKTSLTNAIEVVKKNYNVFTLTEQMNALSLKDSPSPSIGSSSSSSSTPSLLEKWKATTNPNALTRTFIDRTKMPFIDIPNKVKDCIASTSSFVAASTNNCIMTMGFRFLPGQENTIFKDLKVPESLDGVLNLREKLGLSFSKDTMTNKARLKLKGMSNYAIAKSVLANRVLVEAITFNNGYYARFFVLVQIGVGCTVWYAFAPGDGIHPPTYLAELFDPILDYEPFFYKPDTYVHDGFFKMFLAEGEGQEILPGLTNPGIAEALENAFNNEEPFIDVQIPEKDSPIYLAVALGLAVAIILTLGVNVFNT